MARPVEVRGRPYLIGELDGEPDRGEPCQAEFGELMCGETASPHFCEPRVRQVEVGLGRLRHTELDGPFRALGWQREWIVEPFFGVVVWDSQWSQWVRRHRVLWCSVPRRQGKSMIVAALTALFMRILPVKSHMLIGAQNKEEAEAVIGSHVHSFIDASPGWAEAIKWRQSYREFKSDREVSCRIKAVANPDAARGAGWAWAVLDEVAFYKRPEESVQVIRSSWGSIREPVLILISTLPGDPMEWGRRQNQHMLEAQADPDLAPDTLPVISMISDTEDWRSEETWMRVCPALKEGTQSLQDFRLAARQSETNLSVRNQFLTERLNAPAVTSAAYIPGDIWAQQPAEFDLSRDEVWAELRSMTSGIFGGCDFSRVSDLSSFALVGSRGEYLYIWQQSWIPERAMVKLDKRLAGRVSEWIDAGVVSVLPDGSTALFVAERVKEIVSQLKGFEMIGFDTHEALEAEKYWGAQGLTSEKCPQGRNLSPDIKAIEDMSKSRKIIHGRDDVLLYAVNSAEVMVGLNEKWQLKKPDRKTMAARIDPIVAVLTAAHTRIRHTEPGSGWSQPSRIFSLSQSQRPPDKKEDK